MTEYVPVGGMRYGIRMWIDIFDYYFWIGFWNRFIR